MSALTAVQPPSIDSFVRVLITNLSLDYEVYSAYLLPSLSSLIDENTHTHTQFNPDPTKSIKDQVSSSSSIEDLISVLELLTESSGSEDENLVSELMSECVDLITLHVEFKIAEAESIKKLKEEKVRVTALFVYVVPNRILTRFLPSLGSVRVSV
ncbi:hypothetical protein TrLO_g2819 [Triparma laevis f. longispina]|uniref:Uncharacterized protein n=1 Tax=Triparma laevis f. longispina TaxID=1714387 RepID=A0A9W7KZX0_9STRA|nr:hypothetical protein TrLO_g2819 [Triparma laevis f. longispina]